jgi:pyruvate-ferredoxin/flavodoxin oxidoreductase
MARKMKTMDGNTAAAHVSYAFTEVAGIYPITPSTTMAENTDEWAAQGRKNIFGETVKLVEMQSEGGAAATVHGALQAGALSTTYTASQGLLLMIPSMYKMAGELLPGVIHVTARNVATHALSIFGEHSDVYATRQTGFAMLASGSVQEVMDLAGIAHLAAIKGRVPFLHFFDGFRTSHEIQKIEVLEYDELAPLVDQEALKAFRDRALNPESPKTRGTAQNPDVYFQAREASNKFYEAIPGIVEGYMDEITKLTGRKYKPFTYHGAPDAENIIIAMGSVTETVREAVDYLNAKGEKVGIVTVHLFRPFSVKYMMDVMPKSVKKIAVLDRTKEAGAVGEPLYLDVRAAFYGTANAPVIVGGRYGLSSKDTTPNQIIAVYENLKQAEPRNQFSIGIVDDVTFQSLTIGEEVDTVPEGTFEGKFFGLGSDGTVGANKNSIKIIGDHTPLYAQGYFAYDSKKSGGITISHLRFGKSPIKSTYLVNHPEFVACSVPSYLGKYDMLAGIKKNGTFLLNSVWTAEETIQHLPNSMKATMAKNNINFYIINATNIAEDLGLGTRTNTIMQSAFFKLSKVLPYDEAVKFMKDAIVKSYGKKGEEIVKMNNAAVDSGAAALVKVEVPAEWANLSAEKSCATSCDCGCTSCDSTTDKTMADFIEKIVNPMNAQKGDSLPVSAFADMPDGTFPNGTSAYEKRGIAVNVPEWQCDNCIQCNQCAYVCPHAVVRPFLMTEEELKNAPAGTQTIKAIGKGMENLTYRLQVSVLDCTGCGSCADVCPAPKGKALVMKPIGTQQENIAKWDYISANVTYKSDIMDLSTVKGSQFAQPLFEFHGACAGCGETPYIKAITQLFGDRMMIANATGCSSIYGGSAPATPYCKNAEGKGPAWANSLFEDNAEYGYGLALGAQKLRDRVALIITENMDKVSAELKAVFQAWLDGMANAETSKKTSAELKAALEKDGGAVAKQLLELKNYFVKKSVWMFGGDGWAYDIGYGGLDHVIASGDDVNLLVMDTEVYSNTGGQSSKSSPVGQVAKLAAAGKQTRKKDLGKMAMAYGYVYVAQVAMGANQAQYLKAIREAEAFDGPSLIIAYSPCINHGIKKGMSTAMAEEKRAVDAGYWQLYRYNPALEAEGKNPFQLDSKEPNWDEYLNFIKSEVRYTSLTKAVSVEKAEELYNICKEDAKWRYNSYKRLADMDFTK